MQIVKRDGRKKELDIFRIHTAIHKAYLDVSDEETFHQEYNFLEPMIVEDINKIHKEEIDIEQVQNIVIKNLKKVNKTVAKGYKQYRDKRTREREHPIDKKVLDLLEGTNEFLAKENANKNSTLISTQRDLMAGTISRHLALKYKIPPYLVKAHNEGLIKLHDLDYFSNPMTNCELIPLKDLFEKGTVINDQMIETPKSLSTAMTLATQIITQVTSFTYGGCSISLGHLAPYIKVSREKFKLLVIEEGKEIGVDYTENQINKIVEKRLKKEIKDSVQTFNYQISTMNSTNGQSPFVSLFIYIDEDMNYRKETAMLAEEFFKQRIKGMKNEKGIYVTQVFPKIIFTLDEDNIHKDSEYHWLLKLAMQSTAKRMCPDYISAKVMKELYGDVFTCMGCVDGQEIITYKIKDKLYVESFERMWNRLSDIYEVKEQESKDNYYMDLENVLIYDTKNGFVNTKRIIKNKDKGDWTRIKFSNGRSLLATSDHPLPIINKGRTFVKDLKIGDKININQSQYSEESISYNVDKAWLLGFLLCDGCYDDQVSSSIALTGEDDIENNYKKVFKEIYNLDVETVVWNRGERGNYKELKIGTENYKDYKKVQSELLETFGGKQKIYRQIPNEVFSWNKESKLSFLAGMIDADGYINSTGHCGSTVQIGSTNKELALQTMALAQSLGLPSKVYLNHYTSKDKNKIRYRIEFTSTIELLKYMACHKKIDCFTREANITKTNEANVTSIEFLGNINNFSYDVTTESDYFEVSGIHSHNCRSFLFPFKPDGKNFKWYGRMNLGVCTINIPDIALTSKGDKEKFWELLDYRMENLVKPAGILRYDKLKGVKAKVAPLLWQYGVFARLNPEDNITDALDKVGYSVSIGYNGEYEVSKIMTGQSHTEPNGKEFIKQVMKFLDDKANKWKEETGVGFSVYQTPQEESTDWFVNKLIKKFGIVKDVTDKGYITNSYHVDVREDIDVFSKFSIEGEFQQYSKGGNVAYCESGDLTNNLDALYEVIKHMYNTNIHAEINNEGSCKCFKCGYEGKMDYDKDTLEFICPNCGNKDLNEMSIVLRVCGYLSKKGNFIAGRMKDIINRVHHI